MYWIIAIIAGVVLGFYCPATLSAATSHYISVAILAALDSILGGIVAQYSRKFKTYVFLTGFFGNSLLALIITYIGNLLGIDLYLAAVIAFGTRLFSNFAHIRRHLVSKYIITHE